MIRHKVRLVVVVAALTAGCTGGGEPPAPLSSPTAPSYTTLPSETVPSTPPPVTRELDLTPLLAHPCDLLSDAEYQTLGLTKETVTSMAAMPSSSSCQSGIAYRGQIVAGFILDAKYSTLPMIFKPEIGWDWFRQLVIAGQPAVATSPEATPTRRCNVAIGMAKQQSLTIELIDQSETPTRWVCDRVFEVADIVVRKMGGG